MFSESFLTHYSYNAGATKCKGNPSWWWRLSAHTLAEGKSKEKNLRIPPASEPTLYYISSWPGPLPSTPHWSRPSSTLDIAYYFNDATLNIGCCRSCPISAMTWRVSKECWSRVHIRGYSGLQATFGIDGGLRAIFGGGVRWGVGVEGVCSSVGDCWKGLRIRSTPKCLWNLEAVRVQRMLKVSEVRVGKTLRCSQSGKQVVPWHQVAPQLKPSL